MDISSQLLSRLEQCASEPGFPRSERPWVHHVLHDRLIDANAELLELVQTPSEFAWPTIALALMGSDVPIDLIKILALFATNPSKAFQCFLIHLAIQADSVEAFEILNFQFKLVTFPRPDTRQHHYDEFWPIDQTVAISPRNETSEQRPDPKDIFLTQNPVYEKWSASQDVPSDAMAKIALRLRKWRIANHLLEAERNLRVWKKYLQPIWEEEHSLPPGLTSLYLATVYDDTHGNASELIRVLRDAAKNKSISLWQEILADTGVSVLREQFGISLSEFEAVRRKSLGVMDLVFADLVAQREENDETWRFFIENLVDLLSLPQLKYHQFVDQLVLQARIAESYDFMSMLYERLHRDRAEAEVPERFEKNSITTWEFLWREHLPTRSTAVLIIQRCQEGSVVPDDVVQCLFDLYPELASSRDGIKWPYFEMVDLACAMWSVDTVKKILDLVPHIPLNGTQANRQLPLKSAVERGNLPLVHLLLDRGALLSLIDNPLLLMCKYPIGDDLDDEAEKRIMECARFFLTPENEIGGRALDGSPITLLHRACAAPNVPMVKFLLQQPSGQQALWEKTKNGNTPLLSCLLSRRSTEDFSAGQRRSTYEQRLQHLDYDSTTNTMARLIVAAGNPLVLGIANDDGLTAFHLLMRSSDVKFATECVAMMSSADAHRLYQKNITKPNRRNEELERERAALVNLDDDEQQNPLHGGLERLGSSEPTIGGMDSEIRAMELEDDESQSSLDTIEEMEREIAALRGLDELDSEELEDDESQSSLDTIEEMERELAALRGLNRSPHHRRKLRGKEDRGQIPLHFRIERWNSSKPTPDELESELSLFRAMMELGDWEQEIESLVEELILGDYGQLHVMAIEYLLENYLAQMHQCEGYLLAALWTDQVPRSEVIRLAVALLRDNFISLEQMQKEVPSDLLTEIQEKVAILRPKSARSSMSTSANPDPEH